MQRRANNANPLIRFLKRPYAFAAMFSLALMAAFVFTLLDAFVIPKVLQTVPQSSAPPPPAQERMDGAEMGEGNASLPSNNDRDIDEHKQSSPEITAASYKDENIEIAIEAVRAFDTDVYIADVKVSSAEYLKTAFAKNTYGRNVNDETSVIAAEHNAIFAINGDYYGFRDDGWVLRNGVLYRSGGNASALWMDSSGDFFCGSHADSMERQISDLWQIWSFGPPLVMDGGIAVSENQEISGRSSVSNPRTAIGQAGDLHYAFIVSDGRTNASAGLSLHELAKLFLERGCDIAYNFDGGGSSTMVFNGQVVNNPTTGGRRIGEREVSDIVYIGY
ncbi:MAG: phosphodiester glycosidase family protein [Clostridiales bacterium]|jgi:exopolysaccharide biosynthesis protein|nr:phosphodiester glycosidase family protein [Clostridiales bacterium]